MKEVKEFFSTISERISNPFWGSFIIAWIYCNWDIVVGLIFYNSETIKSTFNQDYLIFITEHSNLKKSLILPISYAAGYTFILRYVLNIIVVSTSELFEKIKIWILRGFQKNGWVRFSRLEQERKRFSSYRDSLADLFKDDSESKEKFNVLNTKLREVEDEKEKIKTINTFFEDYNKMYIEKLKELAEKLKDHQTLNFNNKTYRDITVREINNFEDSIKKLHDQLTNSINSQTKTPPETDDLE